MDVTIQNRVLPSSGPAALFPPVPEPYFLSDIFACPLPDRPDVMLFLASYNPACYSERLFSELDIPFPAHLSPAVKKRRAEYLASRVVVRRALRHFGTDNFLLTNDASRVPIWPEGMQGSLSHTHQRISLLLTPSGSGKLPGVDCEHIIRSDTAGEMQKMIITEEERAILQQSGLSFAAALTAAFSVKESLYKALYPSLCQFMSFSEAEIVQCSPQAERIVLRLNRHFSAAFFAGREFTGGVKSNGSEMLSWMVISP